MDIILILTVIVGFYMAWNIGANDVANAMGTSVGSKALTLKKAVILAAILEFSGAFFVGSHVTNTVRKGIFDPTLFTQTPELLIFGMLSALLAAAVWLQIATFYGFPVSTTHSIVGAIIGFSVVCLGFDGVNWSKVSKIVASWVVSPLMGGVISYWIFTLIKNNILNVPNPIKAARRITPWLVIFLFFICTLVMLFKGLKQLNLDMNFVEALKMATIIGLTMGAISWFFIRRYLNKHKELDQEALKSNEKQEIINKKLKQISEILKDTQDISDTTINLKLTNIEHQVSDCMENVIRREKNTQQEDKAYEIVERLFIFMQILSACFVAFAHGANDVANAIGPMAAIVGILKTGSVSMSYPVPLWILGLGGAGIVIGLATWGWRVIETIGKKITELTPTRGFSAEFGAATTIVIASKLGLPISTTHTLVGSVLGVGMARGMASLDMKVIRNILLSWFITLPAGAGLAIIFFFLFKAILG